MNDWREGTIWEDAEIVSRYTDSDAVEDGILVDLDRDGHRVTRALWEWAAAGIAERKEAGAYAPPDRVPVDLMDWLAGNETRAMFRGLIGTHWPRAAKVWEENLDGGIHSLVLRDLVRPLGDTVTVWFVPNELGGITAMFPEDY
jgi:hypothetical protein